MQTFQFSKELNDYYSKQHRLLKTIWIALGVSMVIYPLVLFNSNQISSSASFEPPVDFLPFVYSFSALALASAFLAFGSKSFLLSTKRILGVSTLPISRALTQAKNESRESFQIRIAQYEKLSPLEQNLVKALNRFTVASIISWAFGESIVIWGFTLAQRFKNPSLVVPFAVTGILIHLINYPITERFLEQARTYWPSLE